jgi:hypothetical protein
MTNPASEFSSRFPDDDVQDIEPIGEEGGTPAQPEAPAKRGPGRPKGTGKAGVGDGAKRRARGASSALRTSTAEVVPEIMRMRTMGYSFARIADELGSTRQQVNAMYWRERKRLYSESAEMQEQVEELRDNQIERMHMLIKAWLPLATEGVIEPDGSKFLSKDAAAIVIKCEERLAKLVGLDAPTRVDATTGGQPFGRATPVDMSRFSVAELEALESIYTRAGVLQAPVSDEAGSGEVGGPIHPEAKG